MDMSHEILVSHETDVIQHDVKRDKEEESKFSTNSEAGLGLLRTQDLDVDKLLSLFHGNEKNVEYFIRLWETVKDFSDEDCTKYPCDPRDERKQSYIADWRPAARVCPCDVETSELEVDVLESKGTLAAKQVVLAKEDKEECSSEEVTVSGDPDRKSFHCGVYGCGQVLSSLASYESHYHHCHNYVCATCRRVFVSDFLLDIHLQENHDSYFDILSPRMDMYRCLVQSCADKFRTPELRKEHVVSCHKFPPSFSFHQPIKEHRSKTARSSTGNGHLSTETNVPSDVIAMDTEVCGTIAASSKKNKKKSQCKNEHSQHGKSVPSSICFGRGSQRAFEPRRGQGRGKRRNWYQTNVSMETDTTLDIESVDMQDLAKALT